MMVKEIHLYEWDADIKHWNDVVGKTIEYEVQPRLMIPENSIEKKGQPRYKIAVLKDEVCERLERIIKLHEGEIDALILKIEEMEPETEEEFIERNIYLNQIKYQYESIMTVENEVGELLDGRTDKKRSGGQINPLL
jgi:hypothetical protein